MKTITRYVLRLHVAPFFFSVSALTLVFLMDQVGEKLPDLAGKGLHWTIIVKVFGLSLPFILAQTVPMGVLIAALYVFSRLELGREITALRAAGVSIVRAAGPLLVAAVMLTGFMVWFSDRVLPESNHELTKLTVGIQRKKPLFSMREGTLNGVLPRVYLQAARIDHETNQMSEVRLYDERGGQQSRTVYADSGSTTPGNKGTDLFLHLGDGVVQEKPWQRSDMFRQIHFDNMIMRLPDIANDLEVDSVQARGEREMSIADMRVAAAEGDKRAELAKSETGAFTHQVTHRILGIAAPAESGAEGVGGGAGTTEEALQLAAADSTFAEALGTVVQRGRDQGERVHRTVEVTETFRQLTARERAGVNTSRRYWVEIHKKGSIPAACIAFVLLAVPVAIRYPRGGVALVAGVSFTIFAAYYLALSGGEKLADQDLVTPLWAMWLPNVLFGGVGLWILMRTRTAFR